MPRAIDADAALRLVRSRCELCGEYKKNFGVMCGACNMDRLDEEIEDLPDAPSVTMNVPEELLGQAFKRVLNDLQLHAEWKEDVTTYPGVGLANYVCSACGRMGGTWRNGLKPEQLYTFCPWCGARMREEVSADV